LLAHAHLRLFDALRNRHRLNAAVSTGDRLYVFIYAVFRGRFILCLNGMLIVLGYVDVMVLIIRHRRASTFFLPFQLAACAKTARCLCALFPTFKKIAPLLDVSRYVCRIHAVNCFVLPCCVCELIGGSILLLQRGLFKSDGCIALTCPGVSSYCGDAAIIRPVC